MSKWIPCKERMPKDCVPVNITWVNRKPTLYYSYLKDVPFTATGVRFRGRWYWWTSDVIDYLSEYGRAEWEKVDDDIEITAWMPLPEPYKEETAQPEHTMEEFMYGQNMGNPEDGSL